mgnify:CR=1 FL=1
MLLNQLIKIFVIRRLYLIFSGLEKASFDLSPADFLCVSTIKMSLNSLLIIFKDQSLSNYITSFLPPQEVYPKQAELKNKCLASIRRVIKPYENPLNAKPGGDDWDNMINEPCSYNSICVAVKKEDKIRCKTKDDLILFSKFQMDNQLMECYCNMKPQFREYAWYYTIQFEVDDFSFSSYNYYDDYGKNLKWCLENGRPCPLCSYLG